MKTPLFPAGFLRYGTMNILGMLGISCYILADTFFVARATGADGLAALNLAIPFYSFIHGAGLMVGIGGATRYSLLVGGGRDGQARGIFTQSLYGILFFSACFLLMGLFGAEWLAALFQEEGAIRDMTATYLRVIFLFAPAFLANNLLLSFVRNDGGPQLAMLSMVVSSLSNILLDYLLLFPLDMGIFGAALATGFSPLIGMAILSRWFSTGRATFRLCPARPNLSLTRTIWMLGVPSLIGELSSGVVMVVFNLLILELAGNLGVAAYGVVANLSLVALALFTGLGQGIQPLVSRSWGGGNMGEVRRLLRCCLVTVLTISLLLYLFIFLFAAPITALFNGDGDPLLQSMAEQGLRLYFTALPFAGINLTVCACLGAMDRPRPAFLLSTLRGFAAILPLAVLLARLLGLTGVWLAFPAAELLTAGAAIPCLKAGFSTQE